VHSRQNGCVAKEGWKRLNGANPVGGGVDSRKIVLGGSRADTFNRTRGGEGGGKEKKKKWRRPPEDTIRGKSLINLKKSHSFVTTLPIKGERG